MSRSVRIKKRIGMAKKPTKRTAAGSSGKKALRAKARKKSGRAAKGKAPAGRVARGKPKVLRRGVKLGAKTQRGTLRPKAAARMYSGIDFPRMQAGRSARPFFYTNFVSTIDGKVAVRKAGYWPIGSYRDYQVLTELRAEADALVHGKHTATLFPTLTSLANPEFLALRKRFGKAAPLLYIVISGHPNAELIGNLRNPAGIRPLLVTREEAVLPEGAGEVCDVVRLGERLVDLDLLAEYLEGRGIRNVLVEGGPSLLGSFLAHDFIDEVFLTVAPKVVGSGKQDETLTMVEGQLLPPEQSARFELLSAKKEGDELFLRYRVRH